MNRARLIIKEVQVTRQGEIKNFQIKLPKNVTRVIAIENDVMLNSKVDGLTGEGSISTTPFLSWTLRTNPVMGKLKLRSMERTNIFYEEWLHFIGFNGGVPDMSKGLFSVNPVSLNRNKVAKKVDVPIQTTLITGLFEDTIGELLRMNISYRIKVFVWVETQEDAKGVVFDFQNED